MGSAELGLQACREFVAGALGPPHPSIRRTADLEEAVVCPFGRLSVPAMLRWRLGYDRSALVESGFQDEKDAVRDSTDPGLPDNYGLAFASCQTGPDLRFLNTLLFVERPERQKNVA